MVSAAISVIGNTQGVERMLEVLDTALNPASIAAFLGAEVGPFLQERAKARFANEGDDAVGQWAPLQEATMARREADGYGASHPINKRTGELEKYITDSGNMTTISPVGATMIFPGASPIDDMVDKMETAQKGRQYPSTVPRPVLGLGEKDLVFVLTALARHIESTGKVML